MKANANLEGAAAGVEHRKEREVFPSLIHARPPLPHGGKFSRTDALPLRRRRPFAHSRLEDSDGRTSPTRGGGADFRTRGACEPTRPVLGNYFPKERHDRRSTPIWRTRADKFSPPRGARRCRASIRRK